MTNYNWPVAEIRGTGFAGRLFRIAAACLPAILAGGCATSADEIRISHVDTTKPCHVFQLGTIPAKIAGGRVLIPIVVNGVAGEAILDTGSVLTMITPKYADAVEPKGRASGGMIGIGGLTGTAILSWVPVEKVQIGDMNFPGKSRLAVAEVGLGRRHGNFALVGRDFLDGKDLDLDFAHNRISVYGTENCVHTEPLWTTKSTGVALTRVDHDLDVTVPVIFEGDTIDAVIDTGTFRSLLTHKAAVRAGATDAELANDPQASFAGVFGERRKSRIHKFAEVAVGEDIFKNLPVEVAEQASVDDHDDMILGLDYVLNHHLWLSYSTNALFIDSGEPKSAQTQASAAPR